MAGAGEFEHARGDVEDARESGHEELLGILALDLALRAVQYGADVAAAQRRAFQVRLHRGHEERRGQALARHIRDDEEQVRRVDEEAIVEIAADGTRRLEERGELEAPVVAERFAGIGQQPHLDAARGVDFARHVCGLVAQEAPLALGFRERADHDSAEHRESAERRPGEIEQHLELAKRDEPDREKREHHEHDEVDALQRREARNEPDEHQPAGDEGKPFEPLGGRRTHQRHTVEEVLDHLRMDFDAGNEFAQRGRLEVENAEPRHAHQHDLVAQALGIDLAAEDLVRGHHAVVVVLAVAKPRGAVVLHPGLDVREADREQSARRVGDAQARAHRDPQRLDAERSHDHALHTLDEGDEAHDLVLRPGVHQAARFRGGIDHRKAADVARPVAQALLALARCHHRSGARRSGKTRIDVAAAADAEHHVAPADRSGEELVVGRQRLQSPGEVAGQKRDLCGDRRRRKAVRLREEEVEADGRGLTLGNARDELGHARARPRPLPVVRDRVLVDHHDRHGLRDALEREEPLVAVEDDVPQRVGQGREQEKKRQRGEEHQGENPQAPQRAQRSISSPS